MLEFFQTCCFLSVFWIILTAIFGELLDGIGDADMSGLTMGINFSSRSFLFGVVMFSSFGWMMLENETSLSSSVVLVIAIVIGGLSALLFERLIIRSLKKIQSTSSVNESSLVGYEAELTEPTSIKQFGKARVVINGNTLNFATKGTNEEVIPRGTIVTILEINSGMITIEPKNNGK